MGGDRLRFGELLLALLEEGGGARGALLNLEVGAVDEDGELLLHLARHLERRLAPRSFLGAGEQDGEELGGVLYEDVLDVGGMVEDVGVEHGCEDRSHVLDVSVAHKHSFQCNCGR